MTGLADCPLRPLCEGMMAVSCQPAKRPEMAQAISECASRDCFARFGRISGPVKPPDHRRSDPVGR